MAASCCPYHKTKYSPNRSTTIKQEPHKRAYLSENGRFREKQIRRIGPKTEKDKTEIATSLGRRTREEI